MKEKHLVSIVIPTKNSERTLARCLESIKNQTYKNVDVIVVDSYSTDKTKDIAEKYGAKFFSTKWKLLGARWVGFEKSKGDYILLLDSDQILENTALERAIKMVHERYGMLCLEEHTYEPKTWIQKLFDADRRSTAKLGIHLDPNDGTALARFYERSLLIKAFEVIPKDLFPTVVIQDHTIIYYEAYKINPKVAVLPNAIWHIEPSSLIELWRKYHRYGKSTRQLFNSGFYQNLALKENKFRKKTFWRSKSKTHLLLMLKTLAYQIGYWSGR